MKIEVVNRKAEALEAKIEKHIQRIEDEIKTKVQRTFEEYLQSIMITTTTKSRDLNLAILGKLFLIASNLHEVLNKQTNSTNQNVLSCSVFNIAI